MAAKKTTRKRAQASRGRALGCLFWASLIIVVAAVGYAARAPLQDAFGRLLSTFGGRHSGAGSPPQVTVSPIPQPSRETSSGPAASPPAQTQSAPIPQPAASPPSNGSSQKTPAATAQTRQSPQTQQSPQPPRTQARKARLYFVTVDPSGKLLLKSVLRSIPASDSPLRDTLDALLGGPTGQELNLGLLSMIPTGAHLLGATVKGDTAYLDFSESFRFNGMGLEGMNAQLRQIVYAATEFPTVKSVQLLIEGKRVTYLGTEGARIDKPLTRDSFQS